MNAIDGLKKWPLARIAKVVSILTGERVKRYKDKASALKAAGNPSKQRVVLALAKTGGVTLDELQKNFAIRQAYARDIFAKLKAKGEKITQSEDGVFTA